MLYSYTCSLLGYNLEFCELRLLVKQNSDMGYMLLSEIFIIGLLKYLTMFIQYYSYSEQHFYHDSVCFNHDS